jgi:hypothetical protein
MGVADGNRQAPAAPLRTWVGLGFAFVAVNSTACVGYDERVGPLAFIGVPRNGSVMEVNWRSGDTS